LLIGNNLGTRALQTGILLAEKNVILDRRRQRRP
jgi:hypothetical protein